MTANKMNKPETAVTKREDVAVAATDEEIKNVQSIINDYGLKPGPQSTSVDAMFRVAAGMRALTAAITDEMLADVMGLQGARLGYLTDKDGKGGYPRDVVKRVMVEAMMRGVYPAGNEINIIAGNLYITKEGLSRLVREFPGLTDLSINRGVPQMVKGGATVDIGATWKLNGAEQSLASTVPIRVNEYMGADAILGKATRKALHAIYERITGSEFTIPEGEVGDVIEGEVVDDPGADEVAEELFSAQHDPSNSKAEPPPDDPFYATDVAGTGS